MAATTTSGGAMAGSGGRWGLWVLVGVVAALSVGGLVTMWMVGGDAAPSPNPSPSASAPTSTETVVAAFPDLLPAEDVPWDEVGPGWFILTYTPHLVESDDWHDGWGLDTGSVWVVAPDGRVFDAVTPPDDADYIPYWSGTEIWYATTGGAAESPMGTMSAVDVLTGAVRTPWDDPEWLPWAAYPGAGGTVFTQVGCCGGGYIKVAEPDGSVRDVATTGDLEYAVVTPDSAGVLLFLIQPGDDDLTTETITFMVRSFTGDERTVATLDGPWEFGEWIDDSTVLLHSGPYSWVDVEPTEFVALSLDTGETTQLATLQETWWVNGRIDETTVLLSHYHEETGYSHVSMSLTTGETAPWEPPVAASVSLRPVATDLWLIQTSDPPGGVLASGDGPLAITTGCDVQDYAECRTWISGDRLLLIDDTSQENFYCGHWMQAVPCQRTVVTLVDLTDLTSTILYDVTWPEDKILDAVVYSEPLP